MTTWGFERVSSVCVYEFLDNEQRDKDVKERKTNVEDHVKIWESHQCVYV